MLPPSVRLAPIERHVHVGPFDSNAEGSCRAPDGGFAIGIRFHRRVELTHVYFRLVQFCPVLRHQYDASRRCVATGRPGRRQLLATSSWQPAPGNQLLATSSWQ